MDAEGNWRAATEDEALATELEYTRCWKMMILESHITQVTDAALQAVEHNASRHPKISTIGKVDGTCTDNAAINCIDTHMRTGKLPANCDPRYMDAWDHKGALQHLWYLPPAHDRSWIKPAGFSQRTSKALGS